MRPSSTQVRPTLTFVDLFLLGVGGTLGSGLFLLTGHAARHLAGPSITLSFALAALVCLPSAFSYADLAARVPTSGGAFAFAFHILGPWPALLVGLCLTLEYGVSTAAVARSWASYLSDVLQDTLPSWMSGRQSAFSFLAFLLIIAITALISIGLHHAKWVINSATVLYATVVVLIIAVGVQTVDVDNWSPFFPFGAGGVIAGASTVFFAFIGFDEISVVAEEALNPSRDVPWAIMAAMTFVAVMYVAASLVLTGMVRYDELDMAAPFSVAMRQAGKPFAAQLVGVGTALGMTNTAIVSFAAQPRLFVAMARHGLLPRPLAVNTTRTTWWCGVGVAVIALVVPTELLADVVSGGTLLAFLATNISLIVSRLENAPIGRRRDKAQRFTTAFLSFGFFAAVIARLCVANLVMWWIWWMVCFPPLLILGLFIVVKYGSEFKPRVETDSRRLFTCPSVPFVPAVGALATLGLLLQLQFVALGALVSLMVLSSLYYFVVGARNVSLVKEYVDIS